MDGTKGFYQIVKDEHVRKAWMRLFRTDKIGLSKNSDKSNPAQYGKIYVFLFLTFFRKTRTWSLLSILYWSRRQGGLFYHVSTNDNSIVFRVSTGVIMMDFPDRMLYVIVCEDTDATHRHVGRDNMLTGRREIEREINIKKQLFKMVKKIEYFAISHWKIHIKNVFSR